MTGSHGFVGTNLIETLSREHEIVRWNAREDKVLPECDAVIHLAGLAHDTKHTTEAEKYYEVNTVLTKKLYDRFWKSGTKKFIFFSSIKAKDNDTPYAKSKKQAEDYILNTDFTDDTDKRFYILRPCMIHGKGNKGNLNLLVKWVKKGLPWPLAAFENQRSYASMGNVSYVVKELLTKDVASGIYNLCDDEPVSTNDLIQLINEGLGRKAKMIRVPKSIVRLGAKIGDLLHLPLNTERLEKLTGVNVIDNNDIKMALGINHMPVKAMDGLKLTIQELIKKD